MESTQEIMQGTNQAQREVQELLEFWRTQTPPGLQHSASTPTHIAKQETRYQMTGRREGENGIGMNSGTHVFHDCVEFLCDDGGLRG